MANQDLLLAIIFVPFLGAFGTPAIARFSPRLRNAFALILVLFTFVFSCLLIPLVSSGKTISVIKLLPLGINFTFHADMLAVFMAVTSSLISAVIILYSFGYMAHYENQNEYYLLVVLFLGSMMGIVFSANLIFLYIFWEITAIVSWRLIGFFRGTRDVLRADKAFLVTVFGALVMLVGFISIYQATGSFDLLTIKEILKGDPLPGLAVALILAGIFAKSATLPLQAWLPDAGVAPAPVTALLHAAVLVKIGVYVYARFFIASFNIAQFWHTLVPAIAALSALISAGAAFVETDFKRIVAYSTISQIGFIFFGLAMNNAVGIAGGLLYILMHGLSKAGLFLCAGIVEQNAKTKDITQLGGLIRTMPVTALSFLFCAFSVMGIPPFGGFFCKYLVFAGSMNKGDLFIGFIFLFAACLTILYLFRLFNLVFLGEMKIEAGEGSKIMLVSVAILAFLSLASGILVQYHLKFVELAAQQMLQ